MAGIDRNVDCVIVGGGPAGLSAAVYLGRLRRSVAVVDDRDGRSLWSQVTRNYLGFPAIQAAELRRLGRRQAASYGACLVEARAASIERDAGAGTRSVTSGRGGFLVRLEPPARERPHVAADDCVSDDCAGTDENVAIEDAGGRGLGEVHPAGPEVWHARTVILATGVRDTFPEFEGRDACVGRSLFWCILCDGYESSGRMVVVVGHDEEAVSTALGLLDFTTRVSIVAGREAFSVPDSRLQDLVAAGIPAYASRVAAYPNRDGQIESVVLDDPAGTVLPVDRVFYEGPKHPRSELGAALGVEMDAAGYIVTDSEQKTNVRGVCAAGDVTRLHGHQVSTAVHEGGMAASAANYEMYAPIQKTPGDRQPGDGTVDDPSSERPAPGAD
ncbi:MAG: NAD(P)/FAD-dependent oxidoreductase [Chloroflexi bacterium]|nr:NAD(P)/FAD-dependent oxidoreductase [Chloroflexota bacterium]